MVAASSRPSVRAVWRFFARHKITVKKKSVRAAEQERADVARARRRWMREQGLFDPARLDLSNRVFKTYTDILDACQEAWQKLLDETGRIASIATRDWAMIGQTI